MTDPVLSKPTHLAGTPKYDADVPVTPYGWQHTDDGSPCMEPAWCRSRPHRRTPSMSEQQRREFIAGRRTLLTTKLDPEENTDG